MRSTLKTIGCCALAVVGFLGWSYLIRSEPVRFGASAAPETVPTGVVIYGFVVTLVGVLLGSSYRELQRLRNKGRDTVSNVGVFATRVFRSIDLWMGICGAPLVYALIWKSLEGGSVAGLTVVALQNGFCCTLLISNLMPKSGSNEELHADETTKATHSERDAAKTDDALG